MKLMLASIFIGSCMLVYGDPDQECLKVALTANSKENEDCCNSPDISESSVLEKCAKEMIPKKYDVHMIGCKLYECIVKYEDVTTKDAVDLDKINAYLDKSVPDRDWLPIMKQTASECLTKTTSKLEDLKKSFAAVWNSKPEDCNVAIMSFVECLGTETLVNCPAKSWKNSKGCNELKQSILKCNGNVENLIMQYIGKVPKND